MLSTYMLAFAALSSSAGTAVVELGCIIEPANTDTMEHMLFRLLRADKVKREGVWSTGIEYKTLYMSWH